MTQVARYGHMLKVNVTRMTMHVKASFRVTGSVLNDTVDGEMVGAETRLELPRPTRRSGWPGSYATPSAAASSCRRS